METNEIMLNDEVMDVTEDIVTESSGSCLKTVAGIGVAVVVGGLIYKYVAKPIYNKVKEKKEQKKIEAEAVELVDDYDSEE